MDLLGSAPDGGDACLGPHGGVRRQPAVERLRRPGRRRTVPHRLDADRGLRRRGRRWIVGLGWLGWLEPVRLAGIVCRQRWWDVLDRRGITRRLASRPRKCRLGPGQLQGRGRFECSTERAIARSRRRCSERLRLPDLSGLDCKRTPLVRHIERRRAPAGRGPCHARAGGSANPAAFPATELMPSDR